MRKLTTSEQNKIKLLTKNQVSLTLIEPTANGLKKSIMDATGTVRNFLKNENIHDYELQSQGPLNKIVIPTIIHTGFQTIKSQASLYRPVTKKGDPRIWFSGLKKLAEPQDLLALIKSINGLILVNCSKSDLTQILSKSNTGI